jgi:hypothetical protein
MKHLGRWTVLTTSAIFAFAGCGGVKSTAPSGAIPQAHRATETQLLYLGVSKNGVGQTLILSYPSAQQVATINNFGPMCTDASGNVYIETTKTVTEYAPGGTSPIAQASLPSGAFGEDCAVDATTGDVAVCGTESVSSNFIGWVGVYPRLNGPPTLFTNDKLRYVYCGYDNVGNLFLDGFCYCGQTFSELPRGDGQFIDFQGVFSPGPIQWDGKYITLEGAWRVGRRGHKNHGFFSISEFAVSGSSFSVVGKTVLDAAGGGDRAQFSWIDGGSVVKATGNSHFNSVLGFWRYPHGGSPYKVVKGFDYIEYPLVSTSYSH